MAGATITVRVSSEIAERLRRLADATKRSRSFLAAEAIEEYLAVQEWQVEAINEGLDAAARDDGVDFEIVKANWERRLEDKVDPPGE
jgi:predicted transcriptional regulator